MQLAFQLQILFGCFLLLTTFRISKCIASPFFVDQTERKDPGRSIGDWIVVLKPGRSLRLLLAEAVDERARLEAHVVRTFEISGSNDEESAFSAALVRPDTFETLARFRDLDGVTFVEPDGNVRVDSFSDPPLPLKQPEASVSGLAVDGPPSVGYISQPNAPWNLIRVTERAPDARDYYSYGSRGGAGVTVYVIDTGIMIEHEEFEGRAKWGKSFVDEMDGDLNGHGSHVAGGLKLGRFVTDCGLIEFLPGLFQELLVAKPMELPKTSAW